MDSEKQEAAWRRHAWILLGVLRPFPVFCGIFPAAGRKPWSFVRIYDHGAGSERFNDHGRSFSSFKEQEKISTLENIFCAFLAENIFVKVLIQDL